MKMDLSGLKGYTSLVIGLIAVAVLCCVVCCCTMLRPEPEAEPEPVVEITPEPEEVPEPVELEGAKSEDFLPMVILFRCGVCRQDKQDTHQVSIDGKVIGEVCSDCAQIVIGVFQR